MGNTIFIYQKKKVFEVNFIVPIDIGDSVEFPIFEYDGLIPIEIEYFKVIGRNFIYERAFSGTLQIILKLQELPD